MSGSARRRRPHHHRGRRQPRPRRHRAPAPHRRRRRHDRHAGRRHPRPPAVRRQHRGPGPAHPAEHLPADQARRPRRRPRPARGRPAARARATSPASPTLLRPAIEAWLDRTDHRPDRHHPRGPCPTFIPAAKPIIGDEERAAVDRVLRRGMLAQGPEVAAFEQEFAARCVAGRACVAVNSGTSGLHLGLLAAGIGPGDEVIVPSFTFAATANSVALTGATPVFADIEPDHFCLDPAAVEAAITDADQRRSCRCTSTATRPTWTALAGDRRRARPRASSRTPPRRTAPTLDGRPVGTFGDVRDVQPLPDQEHDLRRGRHGRRAPTTRSRARCGCCATRAWNASTRTRSSASTPG